MHVRISLSTTCVVASSPDVADERPTRAEHNNPERSFHAMSLQGPTQRELPGQLRPCYRRGPPPHSTRTSPRTLRPDLTPGPNATIAPLAVAVMIAGAILVLAIPNPVERPLEVEVPNACLLPSVVGVWLARKRRAPPPELRMYGAREVTTYTPNYLVTVSDSSPLSEPSVTLCKGGSTLDWTRRRGPSFSFDEDACSAQRVRRT